MVHHVLVGPMLVFMMFSVALDSLRVFICLKNGALLFCNYRCIVAFVPLICLINLSIFFVITAFGVDAAFSYKYNQQLGVCNKDGLVISSGFSTSHAIPVWLHTLIYLNFSIKGMLPVVF